MINRYLIYAIVGLALMCAGTGYFLYQQIQKNGGLQTQLDAQREETAKANRNTEIAKAISKTWQDLYDGANNRLREESVRAAKLETEKQNLRNQWAAADQKFNAYVEEIRNDPSHCDNQPVPAAIDEWMSELLPPYVPGSSRSYRETGGDTDWLGDTGRTVGELLHPGLSERDDSR